MTREVVKGVSSPSPKERSYAGDVIQNDIHYAFATPGLLQYSGHPEWMHPEINALIEAQNTCHAGYETVDWDTQIEGSHWIESKLRRPRGTAGYGGPVRLRHYVDLAPEGFVPARLRTDVKLATEGYGGSHSWVRECQKRRR
jgi:hypothetical protein